MCEGVYHSVEVRTKLTSAVPMSNWEEDLVEALFSISFFILVLSVGGVITSSQ